MKMMKKPKKCCKPDCFNCPYSDCRYDGMDTDDFTETNKLDYLIYEESTGRKYHKGTDKEYRTKRQEAYNRENRKPRDQKEYLKKYYQENRERILENRKETYSTKKNTVKCRRWRNKNKEKKREYDRKRYLERKERVEFAKHRKKAV